MEFTLLICGIIAGFIMVATYQQLEVIRSRRELRHAEQEGESWKNMYYQLRNELTKLKNDVDRMRQVNTLVKRFMENNQRNARLMKESGIKAWNIENAIEIFDSHVQHVKAVESGQIPLDF